MRKACLLFIFALLFPTGVFAEKLNIPENFGSGAELVEQFLNAEQPETCSLNQSQREFRRGSAKTSKSTAYTCKKTTSTAKECAKCCERACTFYVCGKPFVNLACKGLCWLTDCSVKP